ncbi:MAG: PadR family transcriptional regulator [Pygmaiobacter massiliensis]|nr:PadR family transcriptional regulator [Pygmaiobacter massiliensis]
MAFTTGPGMLDAVVLSVVSKQPQGTYGYKITQDVRSVIEVSESTLYPVLRRLQKDGALETYDQAFAGRNRRYYKITPFGRRQLEQWLAEWEEYKAKIEQVFYGQAFTQAEDEGGREL